MTATPREIADQTVLIVGGTSGIGLATAEAFDRAGAAVVIAGRSAERGAAALARLGPRATFEACDAGDPDALGAMVDRLTADGGRIDTLVVTTGGTKLPELLFRQSLSDVRESVTLDLIPVLLACRAVLPAMMEQGGGAIVTVASDAAKVATPGESVIGANMAAIVQFTRGIAIEGKRNGIRANTITPSLVEGTPLTDRLMVDGTFAAKLFAKARTLAALGPTTGDDLAALALFLAGPGAARITGQAISVNGGISAA